MNKQLNKYIKTNRQPAGRCFRFCLHRVVVGLQSLKMRHDPPIHVQTITIICQHYLVLSRQVADKVRAVLTFEPIKPSLTFY